MKNSIKGIIFASVTALLWGFLAIALKVSMAYLRPVDVAWSRFVIALVGLTAYYSITQPSQLKIFQKPPPLAIIAGFFLGMNYLGFNKGLDFTSASTTQIFIQLGPVLLALAGFIIYKEKVTLRQVFGFLIVMFGLIFFYREQTSVFQGDIKFYNKGILWVIIGAVSWTIFASLQKKLVTAHPPMQLNLIIFTIPALGYIPLISFSGFSILPSGYWLLVLFLGLNTLAAYGSLAYALKFLEANKISVIIIQNPIITFIALAILAEMHVSWIKSEKFTLFTVLGATMVILGAVLAVFAKNRK